MFFTVNLSGEGKLKIDVNLMLQTLSSRFIKHVNCSLLQVVNPFYMCR